MILYYQELLLLIFSVITPFSPVICLVFIVQLKTFIGLLLVFPKDMVAVRWVAAHSHDEAISKAAKKFDLPAAMIKAEQGELHLIWLQGRLLAGFFTT